MSHDSESGAHEHELRVRAAGEQLAEQGADDAVVEVVTARLSEPADEPAPVTRTVVANTGGVVFDELVHERIDQPVVHWGPLPDLSRWVESAERNIRFVLALVDHEGGDVAVYQSDVPEPESETSAGGETTHVHKVPVGGWSALRYQHETENVWSRNADAVADEIDRVITSGVRLVLLAGDPRSVAQVEERLKNERATVVRLESGGRAEDGGDEAQQQAIREALLEYTVARRLELHHQLKDRLGQGSAVATGAGDIADAFVKGQVDTLLLDPGAAREVELLVRDHPGFDVGAVPEDQPLPADQALVAAAARTGANVVVMPRASLGGAPAAALLRWND
ncbi:Vms1/Ankzf1 family peptidyl-tRNA hydrolase [Kribbella sp. CA-253562]|uniref:baeRF2 domain-containing protein n=1 Tax=Kribbella sp. CA-253562 TaxID=3239942 RepID=UPI003D8DCF97